MHNKKIIGLLLLTSIIAACERKPEVTVPRPEAPPAKPEAKLTGKVNVYNFIEYIPESFKADFEATTGLTANYDSYPDNEALNVKLIAGNSGYDIVTPSNDWAHEQIAQGRYQKIDRSKIPNYNNLDPALMKMLESVDLGNQYLVPWSWGYAGVGVNEEKVKKALGDMPMPENPFDLVFKPEYTSKLKSCGVFFHSSPSIVVLLALQYVGKPDNSDNLSDYKAASNMLMAVRKDVRKFGDASDVNAIADGNYCVFLAVAGDINLAAQRAKNPAIKPLLGKGGLLYIDSMAIPADAKNVENAHAWINYSLEPKVAAQLTNELGYPTPAKAALANVLPALSANKTIFLDAEALQSMALSPLPKTQEAKRAMTDTFRRFKTGK